MGVLWVMKLLKKSSVFIVNTTYNCDGYETDREYKFAEIDDVEKFLEGEFAIDFYGNRQFISYYEIVNDVYENTSYELLY